MKDTARKKTRRQETKKEATKREHASTAQLAFAALEEAKTTLHDAVVGAGMSVLAEFLEKERTKLCGPKHARDENRTAFRAGHTVGELALGGRRVQVRRPRVRSLDGHEIRLAAWDDYAEKDPLTPRAVEQMVLGVSTRKYDRSIEPAPPGVVTRGTSKSAVSRRFVNATRERLTRMMGRSLAGLAISAVMIDGIRVGGYLVLIALGIDEEGDKHVLGVYEGATENATCCSALLSDLAARGLCCDRSMLFVIDGSKALAKSIRATFGSLAIIQRCQVHKKRNVQEHLPTEMRTNVGRTISTAYQCGDAGRAKRMLEALARQLQQKYPTAAASLREGLDDSLTILRLKLPLWLGRTLSSTNPIENINSRLRRSIRNVGRWNGGEMVLRWLALALDEASKSFRRLRGCKGMPKLRAALRAHDHALKSTRVDAAANAA
jgi:putative transposase